MKQNLCKKHSKYALAICAGCEVEREVLKRAESTEKQRPISSTEFAGYATKSEWLNNEFRMIISHRCLGCACGLEKADFNGMLDDLVKAADSVA